MTEKLGDRLKQLRAKKDITQGVVADVVGISRATYAHYEINKREPDFETLKKMADFFNVSTDYLLGHQVDRVDLQLSEVGEEVRALARNINDLNSGDKDLLKAMVETMRKRGKDAMNK